MNITIPIFIPSYNRAAAHTTPQLLLDAGVADFKVVVRPSQYSVYLERLPARNLLKLPDEVPLNAAREFTRQRVRRGQWCLQMDDNILSFVMPDLDFYNTHDEVPVRKGAMVTRKQWQHRMNVKVSFAHFLQYCVADTMRQAQERGAWMAGFSAHENPAFRRVKWADVGYVCGKMMLLRNQGLAWSQSSESAGEDYALTAAHLYQNGRVLINRFGHPLRRHYQPGGCGPYEERLPAMLRAQRELLRRYGALFAVKNASDPYRRQGELRLRFNSLQQVAQWRAQFKKSPNL